MGDIDKVTGRCNGDKEKVTEIGCYNQRQGVRDRMRVMVPETA